MKTTAEERENWRHFAARDGNSYIARLCDDADSYAQVEEWLNENGSRQDVMARLETAELALIETRRRARIAEEEVERLRACVGEVSIQCDRFGAYGSAEMLSLTIRAIIAQHGREEG